MHIHIYIYLYIYIYTHITPGPRSPRRGACCGCGRRPPGAASPAGRACGAASDLMISMLYYSKL